MAFELPNEIRRRCYSALSDYATSPGPKLANIAEDVLLGVDEMFESEPDITEDDAYDRVHEIADSAVPIYTADIMEAASESLDVATIEPECGPAFDGTPTPVNVAAGNLYDIASGIAHSEVSRHYEEAKRSARRGGLG